MKIIAGEAGAEVFFSACLSLNFCILVVVAARRSAAAACLAGRGDSPERSLKISTQTGCYNFSCERVHDSKGYPRNANSFAALHKWPLFSFARHRTKTRSLVLWQLGTRDTGQGTPSSKAEICFDYVTTEESQELTHSNSGFELYDPCLLSEFLFSSMLQLFH